MSMAIMLGYNESVALASNENVTLTLESRTYVDGVWGEWSTLTLNADRVYLSATTYSKRQIRFTVVSNGATVYDLSPLSSVGYSDRLNYYNYNATFQLTWDYDTALSTITANNAHPSTLNYPIYLISDNVQINSTTYQTVVECSGHYASYNCYLIYPKYIFSEVVATESRTLSQSLTNCTSDTSDGDISTSSITVTLTANTDCTFDNGVSVSGATYVVNYNAAYTEAYITLDAGSDGDTISITAIATLHTSYTFSATVTNCTCSLANGTYAENTALTATITPNANCWFQNAPTCNDNSAIITYDSNTGIYTIAFTITQNTTITASATQYKYIDFSSLTNATANYSSSDKMFVGETYNIIVTSTAGHYFDVAPTITYRDEYGVMRTDNFTPNDADTYHTSYYYSLNISSSVIANISVYASAVVLPITDKLGIITMYLPTTQNLSDLADIRFIQGANDTIDIGQYITGLLRVFVTVPIHGNQEINLGGYSTGITSNITLENIVTTDCGTVDIDAYFENVMDYSNTTIYLYLPLYGTVELDTSLAMDKTIHIEYLTNILNGDVLIDVFADDVLINEYVTSGYYEIPYILNRDNKPIGGTNFNASYMGSFTPTVTIYRDRPYNTASIEAPKDEYVSLGTLSGFNVVDVDNIRIPNSLKEEREMIEAILRNGVIY